MFQLAAVRPKGRTVQQHIVNLLPLSLSLCRCRVCLVSLLFFEKTRVRFATDYLNATFPLRSKVQSKRSNFLLNIRTWHKRTARSSTTSVRRRQLATSSRRFGAKLNLQTNVSMRSAFSAEKTGNSLVISTKFSRFYFSLFSTEIFAESEINGTA